MRAIAKRLLPLPLVASLALLGACNKEPEAPTPPPPMQEESAATQPTTEQAPTGAATGTQQSQDLSLADLDAYKAGVTRENKILETAIAKMQSAETDEEKSNLLMEIMPQKVEAQGAQQAGLDERRYEQIKARVGDVLGALEMSNSMRKQYENVDTSGLDPQMAAQMQENANQMLASLGDPYEGISPEVAEALKARHEELATLRAQNIGLLFKAASQ